MPTITISRVTQIRSLVRRSRMWEGPTRDAMEELLDEVSTLLNERGRLFEAVRIAFTDVAQVAFEGDVGSIRAAEHRLQRLRLVLSGASTSGPVRARPKLRTARKSERVNAEQRRGGPSHLLKLCAYESPSAAGRDRGARLPEIER